jgi:hypothetical protein
VVEKPEELFKELKILARLALTASQGGCPKGRFYKAPNESPKTAMTWGIFYLGFS